MLVAFVDVQARVALVLMVGLAGGGEASETVGAGTTSGGGVSEPVGAGTTSGGGVSEPVDVESLAVTVHVALTVAEPLSLLTFTVKV
jgi:hypothetical protein